VVKRTKRGVVSTVACAALLITAACGGGSAGFAPRGKVSIRGQEINVLVPYQVPGRLLAEFTRETVLLSGAAIR
jgi:hypothetical protein